MAAEAEEAEDLLSAEAGEEVPEETTEAEVVEAPDSIEEEITQLWARENRTSRADRVL